MDSRWRQPWLRLRTWLATRVGLWRGRWQRAQLDAAVAHWGWWTWPWQERRWRYAVYSPPGLPDEVAAPLVLLLHGCGQQALGFAQASGWVRAARQGRFRLLCPQQRRQSNPHGCWNWFAPAAQSGRGELDVALHALHATSQRMACNRFAAVGLSAGGGLAALLAFHHADQFDAVVAVAAPPVMGVATLQDPRRVMREGLVQAPERAVWGLRRVAPLLVLHGRDDTVVHPCCAQQLAEQAQRVAARQSTLTPPPEAGSPAADGRPGDAAQEWQDPAGRPVVRLELLSGVGHAWTGAPGGHDHVRTDGPDLTAAALRFFVRVGVLGA